MNRNVVIGASAAIILVGCSGEPQLQTGRHEGDFIVVTMDNPDFLQPSVALTPSKTKWNGMMARGIEVTLGGVAVSNGDFRLRTWGGDGSALTSGVSVFPSVRDENLPGHPNEPGKYGSDLPPARVDLGAQGLRIGYTPLLMRMYQIEPDHSVAVDYGTSRVKLDEKVALVPIQAAVVYASKDAQGVLENGMEAQRLPQQTALWDHQPYVQTTNITDGSYGELTTANHAVPSWYPRDKTGRYRVGSQAAPDTVWGHCGVQFRLVNYFELKVPLKNVFPARGGDNVSEDDERLWPRGTVDDQPLYDNVRRIQADPRFMEGAVLVVFMGRVGFPDAPEVFRAIQGRQAVGISLNDNRSTDGGLAHELGHLSGLGHGNAPEYDVMVNPGPGLDPTEAECRKMKSWADNYKGFWTKPHPQPQ